MIAQGERMVNRRGNNRKMTVLLLLIVTGLFLTYHTATLQEGQHQGNGGQTPTNVEHGTPSATPGQGNEVPSVTPQGSPEVTAEVAEEETLEVHFLDVGEGASVLLLWEDYSMLIDGGGRTKSSYVVSYLERQGVEKLSLLVATHYDSDHINGLIGALKVYGADEVWGPDYEESTKAYQSFVTAVGERNLETVHPESGHMWNAGELRVTVLAIGEEEDSDNDQSLMLLVEYKGTKVLFAGDATVDREERLLATGTSVDCDIYYVSHHGSNSSSSEAFLTEMSPEIAIISVGKNDYGHPHPACMERLSACGVALYRTDEHGAIVATLGAQGILEIHTERYKCIDNFVKVE